MFTPLKNMPEIPEPKTSLVLIFNMKDIDFLKAIVKRYPETLMLAGKAEASPEGNPTLKNDALAYKIFETVTVDPTAIEADRTFLGLLLLKAAFWRDHSKFPNLSKENFKKLADYTWENMVDKSDLEFLLYSLACNDLGKTQFLIDECIKITGKKAADHDQLLALMMQYKPSLFPGYQALSKMEREMYIATLNANLNLGQLIQGENLPVNLRGLLTLSKEASDLRLKTELFDFAGVTGHINPNISMVMTDDNFYAYSTAIEVLMRYPNACAYQRYIELRAAHVGIKNAATVVSPSAYAMGRIVALSRAFTMKEGECIETIWRRLPKATYEVLIKELNETGIGERPGVIVYYAPALIANAIKSTGNFEVGLEFALKTIAECYVEARKNTSLHLQGDVITINVSEKAKNALSFKASFL